MAGGFFRKTFWETLFFRETTPEEGQQGNFEEQTSYLLDLIDLPNRQLAPSACEGINTCEWMDETGWPGSLSLASQR